MSSLPSIAGLTGATLRVVNTFLVALCGTRVHNTMNSFLAMIPMLGIGFTLSNPNCSFTLLVILAGASGIGGGAFASSMSSISFFFPKRKQGLALGINAGFGSPGLSEIQCILRSQILSDYPGSVLDRSGEVFLAGFLLFTRDRIIGKSSEKNKSTPLQACGCRFGNLGVSLSQLFIPIMCSFAAFGGSAVSEEAGVYPHNSGFLYAP